MPLQISETTRRLAQQAEKDLQEQFALVDEIAQTNAEKVLDAFQIHRVAESYFTGTTGYGYDDIGRINWKRSMPIFSVRRMLWSASSLSTGPTPLPVRYLVH